MAALKRKALSLEVKVKILRAVDSGRKKKDVAQDFKIAPSTLSTILSSINKIEEIHANSALKGDRKRDRPSHYPDVEEALFSWFKDVRARNLPVSGALLQTKAATSRFDILALCTFERFLHGHDCQDVRANFCVYFYNEYWI